jgi:hypothetical protein
VKLSEVEKYVDSLFGDDDKPETGDVLTGDVFTGDVRADRIDQIIQDAYYDGLFLIGGDMKTTKKDGPTVYIVREVRTEDNCTIYEVKDGPTVYIVREVRTEDNCTIYEVLGVTEDDSEASS